MGETVEQRSAAWIDFAAPRPDSSLARHIRLGACSYPGAPGREVAPNS